MHDYTHLMNGATVKFYGYRTAHLKDHALAVPRKLVRELEEELAKLAGVQRDNHSAFVVTTRDGKTIVFQFSDFYMYLGKSRSATSSPRPL